MGKETCTGKQEGEGVQDEVEQNEWSTQGSSNAKASSVQCAALSESN